MSGKKIGYLALIAIAGLLGSCKRDKLIPDQRTYANPLDLSYRFMPEEPSRREAADPTVIVFKDKYYLFASKSGGYWVSDNLLDWRFIESNSIPVEEYAPTAIVLGDTVFFLASSGSKSTMYKSADPLSGEWVVARDSLPMAVWDPAFFLDEDSRLYLYWGCSDINPIYGVELDKNNFDFIGEPKALIHASPDKYGWEVPGDNNTNYENAPWIEGAWMNKINGKYYLQYAGPGTEFTSYSDGVYIANHPLGDFELAKHNPFSYKPSGFANGAGHGSTFQDKYGNYWHMATISISQKHLFERRLALYPTFVDADGTLYSETAYGDYPTYIPQKKVSGMEALFPGWMLLSYNKKVEVSSAIDSLPPLQMVDENIRTYWSAKTGTAEEWVEMDLGDVGKVHAVQINFAEHESQLLGLSRNKSHQFILEASIDKKEWHTLLDMTSNTSRNSHFYKEVNIASEARYIRLKNVSVPDGTLAISGFRVFGKGNGNPPANVNNLVVDRNVSDRRMAEISWDPSEYATGYVIRYGTQKEKLYHSYMVYDKSSVILHSLNSEAAYWFTVESFNENGRNSETTVVSVP